MIKPTPEPDKSAKRVIVIVLDGAGVGALPDARDYGDEGSNTLGNILSKHGPLQLVNLNSLGLDNIIKMNGAHSFSSGNLVRLYGRMSPRSPGKDTTSGHWELAGLVLEKAFPLFPDGFPDLVIDQFKKAIGRDILGNKAASGTVIIEELGRQHMQNGEPIVYTSGDSVFQIAAHEDVVSRDTLYSWCLKARELLVDDYAVGRVIARPFIGDPGSFKRTKGRKDYSLAPPGETLLDWTEQAGYRVAVIGKVADIFAHRSISVHLPGGDNEAIGNDLLYLLDNHQSGLIWATFGDFDTVYGHRNDSDGFARALENFDLYLGRLMKVLTKNDLLLITADHGCDPTFPTTDHTREYVPILAWNLNLPHGKFLGTRESFADLAASAAQWLNININSSGSSFIPAT